MSVTEHSNPVRTLVNVPQTVKRPRYLHGVVRQWPALLSLVMLSLVLLAALFPQALSPHEPFQQNLGVRLQPPAWLDGGSWTYPLGTDQLGRDILTRIIYGARISLAVGFSAVAISGLLGVILGLLAGFYGGWVERLITRLIDTQLAIPRILLAVSIIAVLGQGVTNVILVLGFAGWMTYARVVRAQVLSVKAKEYILAARCLGATNRSLMLRHILPNVTSPIIIIASVSVAANIILESSLSFLGLGAGVTAISWGTMLADSRSYITTHGWLPTFPGLAIMYTVFAVNLFGDWLRDYMEPLLRR